MPRRDPADLDAPANGPDADEPAPDDAVLDGPGDGGPEAAADRFAVASLTYLPPPAGLWAVFGGVAAALLIPTVVVFIVALVGNYNLFAPGGPGFATGTAMGELVGGQPLHEVRSLADIGLAGQVLLQLPLWLCLVLPVPVIAWWYGPGITRLIGLELRRSDALIGLPVGIAVQLLAIPGLYWVVTQFLPKADVSAPARAVVERATDPLGVVLLVLIVGIGAPVFEEIFYRGLALRMMERRIGTTYAVMASSMLFAAVHFQKLQFPGLFLFGVVAGVLAVRTGRLGISIWAHVGFNLTTVVLILGNFGG